MILMIDNYDSFTYNIVQYLAELKADVQVYRNDEISIADIERLAPEKIVISPGPCTPNEAGISVETITHFAGRLPIQMFVGVFKRRITVDGSSKTVVYEIDKLCASKFNFTVLCALKSTGRCKRVSKLHVLF